jgi:glycosyltransferase involved in cell wall biosynthesis
MKKRILIFSMTYYPTRVGGAEVALKEITDRLPQSEYEFDMVTLRVSSRVPRVEKFGAIALHRVGPSADIAELSAAVPFSVRVAKLIFPLSAFLKARALHRAKPYDATWAMMANQAGFAALFFKLVYPHVPYFLELQDGNSLSQVKQKQPLLRLVWSLYRRIYLRADRIKAISHFIERLAREVGYTGPLELIPNGVDIARFSAPVPEEKLNALKARYDKRMGDIFLFTASRLVLSRGVEDVIRALPHLPLEVKFLVAGSGEDAQKLARIAREEDVEGRVIFAGHVDQSELPAYYKISDIFVRASLIEGMGNAFIEAFAAGIPVVATPVGGIPDFLTDGQTGVFCEPQNPKSIARAIRRYLEDPALVARVTGNAKKLAQEKYDWSGIARAMHERIFKPLTGRG